MLHDILCLGYLDIFLLSLTSLLLLPFLSVTLTTSLHLHLQSPPSNLVTLTTMGKRKYEPPSDLEDFIESDDEDSVDGDDEFIAGKSLLHLLAAREG